ncbi:hypothetical protein CQW23_35488 [Capsicum baccatum]|uniref:Uncharacterized protein n=1 Tax=Capsicum baccatum TaxID=33114 RepID=A0A2G2UVZ5_CAPBA|nr:hypothetical protein CQW23_35488 [Capsicum baccatum]
MAHASVASLMRTIESLLTSNSPMQSITCDHSEDFSALHEEISSLEVVVENIEKNNVSGEMIDLEVQIKEVANIVEQTIQLRVTEVFLANDENLRVKAEERLSDSLQQVAVDIDSIWKESTNIQYKGKQVSKESLVHDFSSSTNDIFKMGFMVQHESWNLFKIAAFSNEALPYEFETIGNQIADECHGLPLTIVVVAGLLKSKREIEDWKSAAKDVRSFVTNDPDERCTRVLSEEFDEIMDG